MQVHKDGETGANREHLDMPWESRCCITTVPRQIEPEIRGRVQREGRPSVETTQWAHYVASTSIQRRYDVATGYRRCIDVEAT